MIATLAADSLWSVVTGLGAADWWTIATAAVCAVACAIPGCFLVLRRMSMIGDAISHAILPGLAVAFMLSESRGLVPMLAGATAAGLLTALLSAAIHRWGRVPEDAAMGVVFTSLFALGVVLITWAARDVDLDPGCVLYGLLEFVSLDTTVIAGIEVPRALISLSIVLAVVAVLTLVFFKEITLVSFDPGLAASLGFSVPIIHYTFMGAVAATTVVSFEAVGSILVIVMLIAPGATAHLLTDRLARMVWIAVALAISAAVVGYVLAAWMNTSVAGMISVVGGAQFAFAAVLAPRHGSLARLLRHVSLSARIVREDVLGMIYRWHEKADRSDSSGSPPLTAADVADALRRPVLSRLAVATLRRRGLLVERGTGLRLSEAGMIAARGIVRSHRLWESYLAKHLGLPLDHLHEPSHRVEHFITPEIQSGLSGEVGDETDPHGSRIPR